jgi:hypothetical protein
MRERLGATTLSAPDFSSGGSHYFLVAPLNDDGQGSLGRGGDGQERFVGFGPCKPTSIGHCQ